MTTASRLKQFTLLMRLHKPIGILLLLWPTLWALWIAGNGSPDTTLVIRFILGVIIMRSAGCIINDFADRNFDGQVARTAHRPLVTKQVTPKEALILFTILILIAGIIVLTLNKLTILLSFGALALTIIYPFCKRITYLPQLILGLAFAWSIPMSFAAQLNTLLPLYPIAALYISTTLWTVAYDTAYAMADRPEDLKANIKSIAIWLGNKDIITYLILQSLNLITLGHLGIHLKFTAPYFIALLIAAGFVCYQYALLKDREPSKCLKAFLNNQYIGGIIFLGIFIHYSL